MTIDEMFNELENKVRDTVIVTLKYKYDFEENYTIENHILEYDAFDDSYFWLNDWYEGQTDIEVLGYMPLGEVDTTKLSTCEDCISRQATINALYQVDEYNSQSIKVIKQLPPVTPQPKIGHWIYEDVLHSRCSECGKYAIIANWSKILSDFCPNCGAKMEEEE